MSRQGYSKVEVSTDYDWAAGSGTLTEIALTDLPKDVDAGEAEEFTSETASLHFLQDGLRMTGNLRHFEGASNIPAAVTPFWLIVTPLTGTPQVHGGADGCVGRLVPTTLKALDSGRLVYDFPFTYVGVNAAAVIKDHS